MISFRYHISYFIEVFIFSIFYVYGLKRRKNFGLRLMVFLVVSIGLVAFNAYIRSLIQTSNWLVFSLPYMLMIVFFGIGFWICFDEMPDTILLILLLPTTTQLCADALNNVLSFYIRWKIASFNVVSVLVMIVMCVVSFLLARLYNKICFYDKDTYKIINILCYLLVAFIFLLNSFAPNIVDRFMGMVIIAGYRFLMSVFVFFLIFSMLELGNMRNRKILSEVLLKKEEKQRVLASELSELINIKYHDIKNMQNSDLAKEFMKQDEKLLDLYECLVDCGNSALTTVLTEKNIACKNNQIDFTVMADGALLNFMSQIDIYSLFGNALDNAIECLKELPVAERHVKLQVKNVGDMVNIICENTCYRQLNFKNGLPYTTKNDTSNHGFGTKSIERICKKYSAEFKMEIHSGIFTLNILIPTME